MTRPRSRRLSIKNAVSTTKISVQHRERALIDDLKSSIPSESEYGVANSPKNSKRKSACSNYSHDNRNCEGNDYLDNIIATKRARLLEERGHTGNEYRERRSPYTKGAPHSDRSAENLEPTPPKAVWALYVTQLPRSFFSSAIARLEDDKDRAGLYAKYSPLRLAEDLNPDLNAYYESRESTALLRNQHVASYNHFKVALGQLSRYACAMKRAKPLEFSTEGALCALSTDEKLIKAFILQMQCRSAACTVAHKANALRKWADFSVSYFAKRSDSVQEHLCKENLMFLRSTASAEKQEGRRETRARQEHEQRLEERQIILEEDFEAAKEKAFTELTRISTFFLKEFVEHRASTLDARQNLCKRVLTVKNYPLLQKWCLNFCALIVLCAGGQRAQVYAQLLMECLAVDEQSNLVDSSSSVKRLCSEKGHFFLRTYREKTTRSRRMPFVRLPGRIFELYEFHCQYVRIAITGGASQAGEGEKFLLVHSKHGAPLSSVQVTNTVKSFFEKFNSELRFVTPLVLRRSFATLMFRRYARREIGCGKLRHEFLEDLADVMNTSAEQLQQVYLTTESNCSIMRRYTEFYSED